MFTKAPFILNSSVKENMTWLKSGDLITGGFFIHNGSADNQTVAEDGTLTYAAEMTGNFNFRQHETANIVT